MRRGLVHAAAWMLATGAAVTLCWWGVHTVMSGTAYDRPLAVPLTGQPLSSSTRRAQPEESPSGTPSGAPSQSPGPTASPSAGSSADKPSQKPAASPGGGQQEGGRNAGEVRAYPVSGGRVTFSLGASSAELVSATPAAGWRMQVWKQDFWIRVTFTRDGREVSVFCTWHDHPPMVEIVDP
ncbi:hypothetical protein AW27_021285 [Streptomyces sp. PCS3-D2]|uniref:hypothetical protein n=1 Tax=Streptomyces sp. PCS3-D2 TaxID=1460244 RepID=UPI0004452153|nr:hypothetical protein [Streptomyces sp. PCS3-D2]WKV73815.1 hypothetical protein AW27_021285 [Streptomyces sp. PCS3-D2]